MANRTGMRGFLRGAAMLTLALAASPALTAPATAASASSPVGAWSTENGHGVIAIEPCGDALCGRIVGIDRKPLEPMPLDSRGRPQCGLTIIANQRPKGDGTWRGEITDPRNGNIYQANLWLDEAGNLRLRGFLGVPLLGSTQVWRPFTGRLTAGCGMA